MKMLTDFAWIWNDGYFMTFLFGAIFTNCVHMYLNTSQIRRNSETIRRKFEAENRRYD